jgi:hypothetical protein
MYAAAVSYGAPILWQKDGIVTLFWAMVQSSIAGSELSQSFAASLSQRWGISSRKCSELVCMLTFISAEGSMAFICDMCTLVMVWAA